MLIVVTYDVNTESEEGRRRLRQVARICERYGQRVQNSVFECLLDESQYIFFKDQLSKIIDEELDNIRLYRFGKSYNEQIEWMGIKKSWAQNDILVL